MKPTSRIQSIGGKEVLYVNGRSTDGLAYMTYYTDKNRYADFSKIGYRLFSTPVFFASQTLNENSQMPIFSPGIFDQEAGDFSHFDEDIRRILNACPEAMIFPRLNLCLSKAWEDKNPDELCDTGTDSFPEKRRPCFSSDAWAREVKKLIGIFIAHVEEMPYSNHIVGYQIAGGNTDEWFSYDMKGSVGKRAKEKFPTYREDTRGFYRFLSEMTASRILEFAREVKALTAHRLVVGAFYGYSFECTGRESVHHDLMRLLNSDEIDFICSPVSYMDIRPVGQDHPYMLPVDSLKQHHKLYFSENDTRTHLSMPPNDLPHYNSPVWTGPEKEKTIEIIKMHFARAFVFGHAAWWFDMWGGWYADPDYMQWMQKLKALMETYKEVPVEEHTSLAVYVDEKAYAGGAPSFFCYTFRRIFGTLGLPYAKYLAADFDATCQKYKAFVLLEPEETQTSQSIKAFCMEHRLPLWVIKDETTTAEEIKTFARNAGCHIYTDKPAVVYANKKFIFMHTAEEGTYRVTAPEHARLFDVWNEKEVSESISCRKGESFLFKVEDNK